MVESKDGDPLPTLGDRIAVGESHATVRYVGQVPPTEGIWLGVEWDDVDRGKHDGEHNGKVYFRCRQKGAGSFIRPKSKILYGVSFFEALRDKYVCDEEVAELKSNPEKYSRKNLAEIEIEAPNMDKIRKRMAQIDRMKVVGLDGWKVEPKSDHEVVAGPVARAFGKSEQRGTIRSTCPEIEWLDLSRSLLSSWQELCRITQELPKLSTLILHFNRFEVLQHLDGIAENAMCMIKDLRLDGTMVSWSDLQLLSARLPNLEYLQVAANRYEDIQTEGPSICFQSLQTLNLDRNRIRDWSLLVDCLQACRSLKRLILSSNALTSIASPNGKKHEGIRHVSLADVALSNWNDLENLFEWLPALESIVISQERCPFLKALTEGDVRPCLIARSPRLRTLNHVQINDRERLDAELFYISFVERSSDSHEERVRQHPNYAGLCVKHGRAAKSQETVATNTLKSKLLPVRVYTSALPPTSVPPFCSPPSWQPEHAPPIEVKLLVSTPIRHLQLKLAKSLKLPNGVASIASIWALLGQQIDPALTTAIQLRNDLRPNDSTDSSERIVFQLDNLDWDLNAYNFSVGDDLVVVVAG